MRRQRRRQLCLVSLSCCKILGERGGAGGRNPIVKGEGEGRLREARKVSAEKNVPNARYPGEIGRKNRIIAQYCAAEEQRRKEWELE